SIRWRAGQTQPQLAKRLECVRFSAAFLRSGGIRLALGFAMLPVMAINATAADQQPVAKVEQLAPGESQWTRGFWADRFPPCRDVMVPAMGRLMEGTDYTQFCRNFEIAAGLAQGRARGAQFNDGDYYKWIEGASAILAVTNDAALAAQLDHMISVIAAAQRED